MVGVARPSHPVSQQTAIFLTDAEATRLAGHPGLVDAIGVLAAPGFDVSRLRAAAGGAQVLTGGARGAAEYPELERTRTALIPVTAAFGGLAMFIAIFVVASTLGLSIQQREREIALLRAVAATPGQIRRMIAWEAAIVALVGSAAGIWPGIVLGRALAHGLWITASRRRTTPSTTTGCRPPRRSAAGSSPRCSRCWSPGGAPPACRRRSRSPTPRPSRGCWDPGGSSAG